MSKEERTFGHFYRRPADTRGRDGAVRNLHFQPDPRGSSHLDALLDPVPMRPFNWLIMVQKRAGKGRHRRACGRILGNSGTWRKHARMKGTVVVHRLAAINKRICEKSLFVWAEFSPEAGIEPRPAGRGNIGDGDA